MVTIALTPVPQEGPLLQHLVSLGAPFCVDQWQSDWVGSDFLNQSQLRMSVHLERKNRLKGPTPSVHSTQGDTVRLHKLNQLDKWVRFLELRESKESPRWRVLFVLKIELTVDLSLHFKYFKFGNFKFLDPHFYFDWARFCSSVH